MMVVYQPQSPWSKVDSIIPTTFWGNITKSERRNGIEKSNMESIDGCPVGKEVGGISIAILVYCSVTLLILVPPNPRFLIYMFAKGGIFASLSNIKMPRLNTQTLQRIWLWFWSFQGSLSQANPCVFIIILYTGHLPSFWSLKYISTWDVYIMCISHLSVKNKTKCFYLSTGARPQLTRNAVRPYYIILSSSLWCLNVQDFPVKNWYEDVVRCIRLGNHAVQKTA